MLTAEQVFAAHKANLDTLFGLTNKAFEGVEKLVELNLQLAKTALGEVAENTQAALSVKDAQELLSLQAALLQPTAEKAAAYSRHLYDIATSTNSEVTKLAEAQLAEVQSKFTAVVDSAAKNAPGGDGMSAVVSGFNPNWLDEQRLGYGAEAEAYRLAQFRKAMEFLTDVIINSVTITES